MYLTKKSIALSLNIKLSKSLVTEYVHRWGCSVVDSILDPSCKIFSSPKIQGLIGYYENKGCAVVFGDPVCSRDDREDLVKDFHQYCDDRKKNIVYLAASEDFATWMQQIETCALMTFGNELFINPQSNPQSFTGKNGISLRGKIRHAIKNGIVVKEYQGNAPELECQMQEVAEKWLKHRHGPQIYISRVRLFAERYGKRWFYAEHNKKLIGSIVLNQNESKGGWVLDRIMTVPNAPQGASELLVLSAIETVAQEGCHFLSFGATNGNSLDLVRGFGKCTSYLIPYFYKASIKIFNLHRRAKYWDKFHPQRSPAYLVFKKPKLGIFEVFGLLQALNVTFFNSV